MSDRIGSGDAERGEPENGAVRSPITEVFKQGKLNCTKSKHR